MNCLKNFVKDNVEYRIFWDILLEVFNGIVFFMRWYDNII